MAMVAARIDSTKGLGNYKMTHSSTQSKHIPRSLIQEDCRFQNLFFFKAPQEILIISEILEPCFDKSFVIFC